ncbi:PIN domain-containing protein [Roseiflexus sp.]|uniref:PIN domain-containing protein n=1 Tax=Roseiflexus sp. TaxID=2562120 RepID=UPI00398B283F
MSITYVLIDYENVQPDLLPLLNHKHTRIIVFVGAGQKSIPFEFASAMQRLGSRATYIKLSGNGSNALDFHIAFYTGVLFTRDPHANIYIISKDTGFDPLLQHIRARRVNVYRLENIRDIPYVEQGRTCSACHISSTSQRNKNGHASLVQESAPTLPQPESSRTNENQASPLYEATSHNETSRALTSVQTSAMASPAPAASAPNGVHAPTPHMVATTGDQECVSTPAQASATPSTAPAIPTPGGNSPYLGEPVAAASKNSILTSLGLDERVRLVVGHLTKSNKSRPAKVESLRNYIHSLFKRALTDQEVDAIVITMMRSKLLSIDEIRRVTYSLPE